MKLNLMLLAAVALAVAAPSQAQQPTEEANILWAHGNVDSDSNPLIPAEILWMNADAVDADATDTANGPGYCPNSPGVTEPVQGIDPVCLVEQNADRTQDFSHTFVLAMAPALEAAVALDTTREITFNVYFGANSGTCEGTFTTSLEGDGVTVAEATDIPLSFASGYVLHTATAEPLAAEIPVGELYWMITVSCEGTGLFMGIHNDTGNSHIILPIGVPAPEPEAPVDTGNATVGNQTEGNTTDEPEPAPEEPEPETDTEADQPATNATTESEPVQESPEEKDTPAAGLLATLAVMALVGAIRRRT